MSSSTAQPESPFLDVSSFAAEELEAIDQPEAAPTAYTAQTPFLSIYELEGQEGVIDPEVEELVSFLTDLQDPESAEAVFELANEAADLYESQFEGEYGGLPAQRVEAERMLDEHFAPLVREVETLLETMSEDIEDSGIETMSEAEIDAFVDQYTFKHPLSPSFENFGGWLKKKLKKGVQWAKKKAKALAAKAFRIALKKLKRYMKPWLKKIVKFAINKLPQKYRPLAKLLAQRLGLRKEIEEQETFEAHEETLGAVAQLEQEFDLLFANLLVEDNEERQERLLAEAVSDSEQPVAAPLAEFEQARTKFMNEVRQLDENEDVTPQLENFIPAILPLVKLGIKFYGRGKLVKFLAKYIARLIKRFIPRKYRVPLSRAIVDAGLRLINLEATPQDEEQVALEAITNMVEDIVHRVAEAPDYVLDDEELLEAFVLEAFESAARETLPPILPKKVYEERPELRETTDGSGTWVRQPLGRRAAYEKYTRVFDRKITPHMARVIKTWRGVPLTTILQDTYGLPRGRAIKARVHLYKAIPGTWLSRISKYEKNVSGLGTSAKPAWSRILPLTPESAAMVLGEAGLGRAVSANYLADPLLIDAGQRFYYLEIPDAPAQMLPMPGGPSVPQRCCHTHVALDFPQDQIRVSIFLPEAEAQHIATQLRQRMPIGPLLLSLRSVFASGLRSAFSEGMYHQVKVIHGAMDMQQSSGTALKWLPPILQERLVYKLVEWVGYSLHQQLQQRAADIVAATEDPANGLTIIVRFNNPPGFANIRRILAGEPVALRGMQFPTGMPEASLRIVPGYYYG